MSELIETHKQSKSYGKLAMLSVVLCWCGIMLVPLNQDSKLLLASAAPVFTICYMAFVYLRVEAFKINAWNKVHEPENYDAEFEKFVEGM